MRGNILHSTAKARPYWLAVCVALSLPLAAVGQDEESAVVEEALTPRYTVELIVFEYTSSALAGNERFLPQEPPADDTLSPGGPLIFGDPGAFDEEDVSLPGDDPLVGKDDADPAFAEDEPLDEELEELPSHIIQTQLQVLDPATHAMTSIYQKLQTLDAYRPIMRAAWTQLTYEKDQTLPIRLRRLGQTPLRLDGTVMLYLSRYLHFVVDISIERQEELPGYRDDRDAPYYGDRRSPRRFGFGYQTRSVPIRYKISEDRIFRNGELRYFDHPKFGVLARVTRVEEEPPESDEMFLAPAGSEVSGGN